MGYGREDYARYYYLWHLIAIGVLKVDEPEEAGHCPKIDEVIWDDERLKEGRDGVKVALIDMGIAEYHPNLEGKEEHQHQVIRREALDLASHRYGAKYAPMTDRHREERANHLQIIDVDLPGPTPAERAILDRLKNGWGVERYARTYDQHYATHGTSCAGLVCGTSYDDDQFGNQGNPIIYYGVDPYCKIVPITTSISPDPEQLIAAFLYAHALGVDVILFPRDAADPGHIPDFDELDDDEKTRLDRDNVAWDLLGKVILRVSMDIPVVCAAGNEGRSDLIYPASLAKEADNGVIAVGAVSYAGYRSGYSNYGDGLTVVAPSDDGEVYNRHQIRLDMKSPGILDFWIDDVHEQPDEIPTPHFSAERLITLDIPGPRGYASGSREGAVTNRSAAVDDPGGLYTDFGGTSGAAAIVAGVVALMQRQEEARLSGIEIKDRLVSDQPNLDISHWYWPEGSPDELRRDAINSSTEPTARRLFGAGGLVHVPSLLNA